VRKREREEVRVKKKTERVYPANGESKRYKQQKGEGKRKENRNKRNEREGGEREEERGREGNERELMNDGWGDIKRRLVFWEIVFADFH
jgi:hypothetical protein